jgi:hypothetical protein
MKDDRPTRLDYEPRHRRPGFWAGVPLVVKVFIVLVAAIAVVRTAIAVIWLLWGRLK